MSSIDKKIKYLLPKYTRGKVLEICRDLLEIQSDQKPAFPHFGLVDRDADLSQFADESLDAVVAHTDFWSIAELSRFIKPGGYICLTVENFEVYTKLEDGYIQQLSLNKAAKKTACVGRQGGFGDMIQTALVFPRLKEMGYHLTVLTTPRGQDIVKHDPNVDDWYIVDTDQIPNPELLEFWKVQKERYDLFVDLSESIEGHLLAMPDRTNHRWSDAVRRKRMNTNYHEWTAELVGVPFKPCKLFYATEEEKKKAACDDSVFTVIWALSGSSHHKFTPHQDAVIARILLEMPEARVLLVGDFACKLLEQGWEDEERVVCLSDKLSIRDTLALAQAADLVVGPETGVLNAVGFDEAPHKILLLSHSSANNLSKHWKNVQALTPVDCPCYPCHRLHYGSEYCTVVEETGAALCAQNIGADVIYAAVEKVYRNWRRK